MYGLTEKQYKRFISEHPNFENYETWAKYYVLNCFKKNPKNFNLFLQRG